MSLLLLLLFIFISLGSYLIIFNMLLKHAFFRIFFSEISICGHNIPYAAWHNIDSLSDFYFSVLTLCPHIADMSVILRHT